MLDDKMNDDNKNNGIQIGEEAYIKLISVAGRPDHPVEIDDLIFPIIPFLDSIENI